MHYYISSGSKYIILFFLHIYNIIIHYMIGKYIIIMEHYKHNALHMYNNANAQINSERAQKFLMHYGQT